MRRWWPVWVLGAAVIALGLALWSAYGRPVWLEQVIAWCT